MNIALLLFLILITGLLFSWEGLKLYTIYTNDYFLDEAYYLVLILFTFYLFGCLIAFIVVLSFPKGNRKYTKWAVLVTALILILIGIWVIVYIKYIYKLNDEFVYVNGFDRRNNHKNKRTPHQIDADDGYREHHNQSDYDLDIEKDKGDNGPDIDLEESDYEKGIDPSYKKHTKKHYLFTHTWVEFAAALVMLIIFVFLVSCGE